MGVHSGNYGNWIPNPAQRLALLLASMKDEQGRVLIEGFNDGVAPLTAEERAMLDAVPDDARVDAARRSASRRRRLRIRSCSWALQYPTLNVRGLVQRIRRRWRADDHPRQRHRRPSTSAS